MVVGGLPKACSKCSKLTVILFILFNCFFIDPYKSRPMTQYAAIDTMDNLPGRGIHSYSKMKVEARLNVMPIERAFAGPLPGESLSQTIERITRPRTPPTTYHQVGQFTLRQVGTAWSCSCAEYNASTGEPCVHVIRQLF